MPLPVTCPGFEDLESMCSDLSRRGVPVTLIGHSRGGRPIRMISPAMEGAIDALVVGTPHPNEPIGGCTIQAMLDLLLKRAPALAALPLRWHFIPTIEPDGLALNGSWLSTPHDPGAYFRGFYRPAFRHQAEFAFPLITPHHRFDTPTPEARAWMSAIDELRPALMVSLHNADHGGAFHVLSRPHPGLAAELSLQSRRHGIALDEGGDPYAEQRPLAPGVFLADDFEAIVAQAPGAWTAGNSSFGYASQYGTLGLVPEVPLWQETEVDGESPPSRVWAGLADDYEATIAMANEAEAMAGEARPPDLLLDALVESAAILRRIMVAQSRGASAAMPSTLANLARRRLRMLPLRTLGMLCRWCDAHVPMVSGHRALAARQGLGRKASDVLTRLLDDPSLTDGMVPVPLQASVTTQIEAILSAAAAVCAEHAGRAPAAPGST